MESIKKSVSYVVSLVSLIMAFFVFALGVSFAYDSSEAPVGYVPQKEQITPFQILSAQATPDILLIQTAKPWNSDADTTVLDALGYAYKIIGMSDVPTTNIDEYQVVLIVNDQVQSFYDNYANNYSTFYNYVNNGGTLVFFACDHGWAEGDLTSDLPGGVSTQNQYECNNYIVDYNNPIVTGELTGNNQALTDDDTKNSYCSHGYFNNLDEQVNNKAITNLDVIFKGSDSNMPTLVKYSIGRGNIIASMNTWEYSYEYPTGSAAGCERGPYAVMALDDIFKYAFTIAGEHKATGVNISTGYPYIDDAKKPGSIPLKTRNDIVDIVSKISNNDPENNNHNVNLSFLFPEDLQVRKVFQRNDMSDYDENTRKDVVYSNDGIVGENQKITIENIQVASGEDSYEYVVRVSIPNDFDYSDSYQDTFNVKTQVSGIDIETKISDERKFLVYKTAKLIITNRRLLYKTYSNDKDTVSKLLQYLYEEAHDPKTSAIIYYVDKYDESGWTDKNPDGTPFIDWFDDRKKEDCYDGETDYNEVEEACINRTTNLIDDYVNYWVDNLGGAKDSGHKYLLVVGGDEVIPHYRVWDPWKKIKGSGNLRHLSSVQKKAAEENYIFSDIIYYDTDNIGWGEGKGLENIYVGRIPGYTAENVLDLIKNGIWKANQLKLTRELLLITREEGKPAKNAWGNPVPDYLSSSLIIKKDSSVESIVDFIDKDDATKQNLFNAINDDKNDIDFIWTYHHGSPYGLSGSHDAGYPSLIKGSDWSAAKVDDKLNDTRPISVASACWSGIVDDVNKSKDYFAAKTLQQKFSGLLGATSVTPSGQKKCQQSIAKKVFSDEKSIGQAVKESKVELGNNNWIFGGWRASTRFSYVYYGVPWIKITHALLAGGGGVIAGYKVNDENVYADQKPGLTIQSEIMDQKIVQHTETILSYQQDLLDGYDIIKINNYYQNNEDNKPVVPQKIISFNLPLNATLDNVNLIFDDPSTEENLNLPLFQYLPPVPKSDIVIGYSDIADDYGQVPSERYSYNLGQGEGHQLLTVAFCPLLYDPSTDIAQIYKTITLSYTITTPNKGVVDSFLSDKQTYSVGEAITTNTAITNISDSSVTYGVTINIESIGGSLLSTISSNMTIESGKSDVVEISPNAPTQDGVYKLQVVVSDGENEIGRSYQMISVVSGKIVSFEVPKSITKGDYGTFTFDFQNLSNADITAYIDIYILNSIGEQAAKLPQLVKTIGAEKSEPITSQWFPSETFASGSYSANLVVTVNDVFFSQSSDPFIISGANDIVLISGWNLISLYQQPPDISIGTVLDGISSKYSSAWAFQNNAWKVYDPANPGFSDLNTMEAGWGYWLNMTEATTLTVLGSTPSNSIDLVAGWNLVGYNSSTSQPIADALSSISGKFESVWAYINGQWKVYDPANPGFSELTTMEPGYGYWIKTTEACTWILP